MAKILVVEDDELLRQIYSDTLIAEGYTVETAEDGEVALAKIKQGGWDLVYLDIILPKMNGLDIIEKIKSEPAAEPNKCIIFLTNLDKGEEIKKALLLGNGYIIKSQITPGDLIRETQMYLNSTGQQPAGGSTPPASQ